MGHRPNAMSRERRRSLIIQLIAFAGIGISGFAFAADARLLQHHDRATQNRGAVVSAGLTAYPVHSPSGLHTVRTVQIPDDAAGSGQRDRAEGRVRRAAPLSDNEIDENADPAALPAAVPPPAFLPGQNVGGLPTSLGVFAGSFSAAPQMMGDFFGGSFLLTDDDFVGSDPQGSTLALAGGDRRFKITENVSPVPQDRVFFNYNRFHNAVTDTNNVSQSVDRFTFGTERTFQDGLASVEMRLPFAAALDSTQIDSSTDTEEVELGNLGFALKVHLLSGINWLLSAGTTLTLPTGDDFELIIAGDRVLLVQNEAVHLAPFLGYLAQPNQRWFAQGFLQADFDLNGNDVFTDANGFEGTVQDQNLLFVDASVGHWLRRTNDRRSRLSGIAALAELHYTATLNDTDEVADVTNPFNRMDILNATGALHFQFDAASLRVGAAAPLTDDEDRFYDAEIVVQFNRFL